MYINCISILALNPINVMGEIPCTKIVVLELKIVVLELHIPSARHSDLNKASVRSGVIKNGSPLTKNSGRLAGLRKIRIFLKHLNFYIHLDCISRRKY